MKIDSPSSITSREASIRLEWISTRILPGVAVLLLSIPLCQWADSNLPDGIVPVFVIYMMIVVVLWTIYLAVQYAFVGIAQTRKAKDKVSIDSNNPHEEDVQTPVFLLEAKSFANEPEDINPVGCVEEFSNNITETEVTEEIAVTDNKVISDDETPDNEPSAVSAASPSSTYQQGIDDFYQSQAASQKKKLDTIHEYLLYIMSPFIYEEDMDEFCTDLLRFAMDHNYRPEVE